jgi:hypothetical protein
MPLRPDLMDYYLWGDENGPWQGMHIQRNIFNAQLISHLKESGVPVLFNQKVDDFIWKMGK